MELTLDKQVIWQHCAACKHDFKVVRGSVFGDVTGLYLIALHGHAPTGRLAHMSVSVLSSDVGAKPAPLAAAIEILATPTKFEMSLVEWATSPWRNEHYLGQMLAPEAVRATPLRPTLFQIAGCVVERIPEVREYFAQ